MAQKRKQPEIIAGRVSSTGTLDMCTDPAMVVTKGASTGRFLLYFPAGFRPVSIQVMQASGGNTTCTINGYPAAGSPYEIVIFLANTAAAADVAFTFTAVGYQQ